MYITHNLRTNLQEWRNRLYNTPDHSDHNLLKNGLNVFLAKIQGKPTISSILLELDCQADTLSPTPFQEYKLAIEKRIQAEYNILLDKDFNNSRERAMHHYQFLKVLQQQNLSQFYIFLTKSCMKQGKKQEESTIQHNFVRMYLDPLIDYVCDQLVECSSVLYLLIKYKTRCEWFYSEEIRSLYERNNVQPVDPEQEHNGEDVQPVDPDQKHKKRDFREERLNKDLRKFLFDQGIDSAFLDPLSPSGKADVVALLDTQDPLVLEIKIFDRQKKYNKDRLISGFSQIVSYSNNYNKPIGYLLVFNMDKAELDLVTQQNDESFPAKVVFNGKTYFIIFVNLPPSSKSASKRGKVEKVPIREEDLTSAE
jgi:hypothetical protein